MKSNIDELIETADRLCAGLDKIANDELRHIAHISLALENYSWDVLRMANDLKHIRENAPY